MILILRSSILHRDPPTRQLGISSRPPGAPTTAHGPNHRNLVCGLVCGVFCYRSTSPHGPYNAAYSQPGRALNLGSDGATDLGFCRSVDTPDGPSTALHSSFSFLVSLFVSLVLCDTATGEVEAAAAVLARLLHVALPLWVSPADSAPVPVLSKLLSSLLSSPLVVLSLLRVKYCGRPSSALLLSASLLFASADPPKPPPQHPRGLLCHPHLPPLWRRRALCLISRKTETSAVELYI